VALLCFVGNWFIVLTKSGEWSLGLIGHLWSVSIEEQFYLVWPWVLRWWGARRLVYVSVVIILVALIARLLMVVGQFGLAAFWYNTFTWIDAISAGAILTLVIRKKNFSLSLFARLCLLLFGPVAWVAGTVCVSRAPVWGTLIFFPLTTLGSVSMLAGALGAPFLGRSVLVYLGRISYGLYVFHFGCLFLATWLFPKYSFAYIIAALLLTIGIASVSYYLLELPFLRLKQKFTFVQSVPAASPTAIAGVAPVVDLD
jgi:peptidoglycan/LPS O-acetylase OafA/YrhL